MSLVDKLIGLCEGRLAMRKLASFVVGLFVGILCGAAALIYLQAQRVVPTDEIVFAAKNFYDASAIQVGYVTISGTVTGDGLAYPNNTRSISCWSDIKQCYVAEIEQIGHNQIGQMTSPYPYPIVKWSASVSRGNSSLSLAFTLTNFIFTLGGMAKSTSRKAVPNFMVL
jgi:hypothetical protein